jgi:formylmethanofuran dehydrogenase subunit A
LAARQAHFEFADTPAIDKAMLVLVGNNQYVMDCIRDHQRERLRGYLAWLLGATRGFGLKAVNPGGVEQWKQGRGTLAQLDEEVSGFGVTPRAILVELARAADELALPHPLHVHGLRLGIPGCAAATLELLQALDGHRLHLAHVQFLSYDGEASKVDSMASGVQALANYLNAHEQVTCDVGQVLFGETTSMTADGPVGEYLHRVTGRKWLSHDVELETGCGVVPIEYSDRNFVHALQWCIGLEWFLMVNDPWKMALSTDHPNGATFWSYPRIIALLMSKNLRDETFKRLPRRAQARSSLLELGREYSLSEIAIVTRAAPARMLGQSDRGHLGPGARADVVVYSRGRDIEKMFELPRWVLKGGRVILEEGALRDVAGGEVLRADLEFDDAVVPHIHAWFDRDSSIQFNNFALREDEAK